MRRTGSERRERLGARRRSAQQMLLITVALAGAWSLGLSSLAIPSGSPSHPDRWSADGDLPWRAPIWTVDVNRADWPELSLLPGVSRAMAERLVDERRRSGPLDSLEDLDRVPGVGPSLLRRWNGLITW
ncbi:MAG: helix-hairpin-helix domain-containing protein [Pirellulales bacterium]